MVPSPASKLLYSKQNSTNTFIFTLYEKIFDVWGRFLHISTLLSLILSTSFCPIAFLSPPSLSLSISLILWGSSCYPVSWLCMPPCITAPKLWLKHQTRRTGPLRCSRLDTASQRQVLSYPVPGSHTHQVCSTAPMYINQWQYDYLWMDRIHYLKQCPMAYSASAFQIKLRVNN